MTILSTILASAVFGALVTGIFGIITNIITARRERDSLIHGFYTEIVVGRADLLNGKQASAADLRFIANSGLPYQFYEANRSKIGIVGPVIAPKIVSYYSLRWQFYEKKGLESGSLKAWNGKLLEAADAALESLSAHADKRRPSRLRKDRSSVRTHPASR